MKNKHSKADNSNSKTTTPKRWLLYLSVVCGIVAIIYGWNGLAEIKNIFGKWLSASLYEEVDGSIVHTFNVYDTNGDGYLTIDEFVNVVHDLNIKNIQGDLTYEKPIKAEDEVMTIQSLFEPLNQETLTTDKKSTNSLSLRGLRNWTKPQKDWKNFGVGSFQSFLPQHSSVRISEPYYIIKPTGSYLGQKTSTSARHYPNPLTKDGEIMVHRLLQMFHTRPFVQSRFAPQGAVACIRAYNEFYFDIVFRIHAEFQLNEPPLHPFWFTPAQFTGHIVIRKDLSHVHTFHMFVPADKRLNVDMEWLNGPSEEDMEVDIGYMPQMELRSTSSSILAVDKERDRREGFIAPNPNTTSIYWDEEISFEDAAAALEVKMYPFKQVQYHSWKDVWKVALKEQKPVHSIVLWGALDDQSC